MEKLSTHFLFSSALYLLNLTNMDNNIMMLTYLFTLTNLTIHLMDMKLLYHEKIIFSKKDEFTKLYCSQIVYENAPFTIH